MRLSGSAGVPPARFGNHLVLVLLLVSVSAAAADYKLQKNVALPDGAPSAAKELVQPQGIRVLDDSGAPYAEIWLAKSLPAEAKPLAGEVQYSGIPEGSFLGLWRFVAAASDYRGQSIKPSLYSMRYELMPSDGNHLGAAQFRDFLLLLPADADSNPTARLKFEDAAGLSRKASGTGHPAVFPLFGPEKLSDATIAKAEDGSWVLKVNIPTKAGGAIPVSVVVFGRSEH